MAQRQGLLGALLLALMVVAGYALVTGSGFLWPEHPTIAMVASICVSIIAWLASCWWFQNCTGWPTLIVIVMFALALVFPMVGTASLGTDLALEHDADRVSGEVVDVAVDQTNHREGQEAWKTTYTFVATDDGRELGTVDYSGKKNGYHLEVGDRADVMADPSGRLPLELADEVDSSNDIGMIVIGGVLFFLFVALGVLWQLLRPSRRVS